MKATRRRITRVTLTGFAPGEVPDVRYSRTGWLTPETVTIEFADQPGMSLIAVRIAGLSYRLMASGERRPTRRDEMNFRDGGAPPELHPLILEAWDQLYSIHEAPGYGVFTAQETPGP